MPMKQRQIEKAIAITPQDRYLFIGNVNGGISAKQKKQILKRINQPSPPPPNSERYYIFLLALANYSDTYHRPLYFLKTP